MRSGKLVSKNDSLIEEAIFNSDYIIKEDGTVWSLICRTGKRSIKNLWRRIDKLNKNGYSEFVYKKKKLATHRVIFRKFNGKLEKDLVINHIDNNPKNNKPINLELVSASKNLFHAYETGRLPTFGFAKINLEIANEIRILHSKGVKGNQLANMFSLSKGNISDIVNNKIWKKSKQRNVC